MGGWEEWGWVSEGEKENGARGMRAHSGCAVLEGGTPEEGAQRSVRNLPPRPQRGRTPQQDICWMMLAYVVDGGMRARAAAR